MKTIAYHINRTILYFFLLTIAIVALLSFALKQFSSPLVNAMGTTTYYLTLLGVIIVQFALLWFAFLKVQNLSQKSLKILQYILFVVSILFMGIMMFSFRVTPITDAWAMLDQAKYLAEHPGEIINETSPYFVYFSRYGNNSFLTVLFVGLFRLIKFFGIKDEYYVLHGLNMIVIILGNFFAFQAVKEWAGHVNAVKVLLLLTLNPVSYVLILWVYSCSFSIPLMTGILWLGMKLRNTNQISHNVIYVILIGFMAALSFLIRPTSFIPCIALAFVAILRCLLDKKKILLTVLLAAICLFICLLVTKTGTLLPEHYFEKTRDNNSPMTHWIMMGSHDSGKFDGSDEAYTFSFQTKEEKTSANLERTKENYTNLGLIGTLKLWTKKLVYTFGDGWSETDIRSASGTKFSQLYPYFAGDRKDFLFFYCQAFRIVLFLFMLLAVFQWSSNNYSSAALLCILTTLGGMLFYCIWEAKSIYSAPFVPVMIMIAGQVQLKPIAVLQKRGFKNCVLAGMGILGIVLSSLLSPIITSNNMPHTEYRVRAYAIQFTSPIEETLTTGGEILQSFYPKKVFNTATVYANVMGNGALIPSTYEMQILDFKKNILRRHTFTTNDIQSRNFTYAFEDIDVETTEPYYVKIIPLQIGNYYAQFLHRNYLTNDTYPGVLEVNNTDYPYDLFMTISKRYSAPY